jgi:hypothetical protein
MILQRPEADKGKRFGDLKAPTFEARTDRHA